MSFEMLVGFVCDFGQSVYCGSELCSCAAEEFVWCVLI